MAASSSSSYTPILPRRKVLPTVLTFMAAPPAASNSKNNRKKPMADIFDLLRQAVNEKKRIEVLTRDCRGIDGILIGWLIAFDKHMNLIMSDVDEVCRRVTDGQDYLELGAKRENRPPNPSSSTQAAAASAKPTDVPRDFQSFREQLANFLRNKKKTSTTAPAPRRKPWNNDDTEDEEEEDARKEYDENRSPAECHPEQFLPMQLLTINNVNVQRLSGKMQSVDASSSQTLLVPMSKRPKVRFFSRHIPKLFVKGNQVCLIRLLSS